VPRGGHNIIEPAAYGKAIVVGPHTENFRQIVSDFLNTKSVAQIRNRDSLAPELVRLLSDPEEAAAMGKRANDILVANRGATDCTIQLIKAVARIEE
jgi:3-deoxy-D-manno-octulosonic-acid transferase